MDKCDKKGFIIKEIPANNDVFDSHRNAKSKVKA